MRDSFGILLSTRNQTIREFDEVSGARLTRLFPSNLEWLQNLGSARELRSLSDERALTVVEFGQKDLGKGLGGDRL